MIRRIRYVARVSLPSMLTMGSLGKGLSRALGGLGGLRWVEVVVRCEVGEWERGEFVEVVRRARARAGKGEVEVLFVVCGEEDGDAWGTEGFV